MNHHSKNVMFDCGFLMNEKIWSFVWLFETFLNSMGGKHPITVMTDEAFSMASAIKLVFPLARHKLCCWHIIENSRKNIGRLRSCEGFTKIFKEFWWIVILWMSSIFNGRSMYLLKSITSSISKFSIKLFSKLNTVHYLLSMRSLDYWVFFNFDVKNIFYYALRVCNAITIMPLIILWLYIKFFSWFILLFVAFIGTTCILCFPKWHEAYYV